jgi:hypothetical protein
MRAIPAVLGRNEVSLRVQLGHSSNARSGAKSSVRFGILNDPLTVL